ncbi:hypothetical protein [Spiroplasma endosymbiont of Nebria brevicollis]|uniref:hypothetical protein n=1 Tax=Spiroplasma endosymbiont of Nebria brevicollis TaxID=3066284 RepID=UPI00313C1231
MQKFKINDLDIEVNITSIKKFLDKIEFPIAIFDFETFRNLLPKKTNNTYSNDFEKIFSIAILVITKKEDLTPEILQQKNLKLFIKTLIPNANFLKNNNELIVFQAQFYKFLISKLLKYHIKSLVVLGARTEVLLLKNYLAYHIDEAKNKSKITYFFHHHKIFDLYDIWNKDHMLNLPLYKKGLHQDIGATKKTWMLIKNNDEYWKILKPQSIMTNNDIGRIIDQYFFDNLCLLPTFSNQVANHNQNDVLIGAAILSLLYELVVKK